MNSRGGELAAARWLDAEDAAVHQALGWALDHDPSTALRLAVALAPWWELRGRLAAGHALLQRAIDRPGRRDALWFAARFRLGRLLTLAGDYPEALVQVTAVCDALADSPSSREYIDGLTARSMVLRNLGQLDEAADQARQALALARQAGDPAGEAQALAHLGLAANYAGDGEAALEWVSQAQQVDPAAIPDKVARRCSTIYANALVQAGQTALAQEVCRETLARARAAGDLGDQANLLYITVYSARRAGQIADAGAHLRESIALAEKSGDRLRLIDNLDDCAHICAATGRWAEAVTLCSAYIAHNAAIGVPDLPQEAKLRGELLRQAAHALGPDRTRAAQERGAAMTLDTAADFATMLASPGSPVPPVPGGITQLSTRERELVTLVARGRTDAQIATDLSISASMVRSQLTRIRAKVSCRRRADLTRLALAEGLV